MKPFKTLIALLVLGLLAVCGQAAAVPTLSLEGPDQADPGDVVNFELKLADASDVASVQAVITLDAGIWGLQSWQLGDLLDPTFDAVSANITNGQLWISISTVFGITTIDPGVLADIVLQVLPGASDGPTDLIFDTGPNRTFVADDVDETIPDVSNKSFTVNAQPVAVPPALALMVPGLLLLARRRSA